MQIRTFVAAFLTVTSFAFTACSYDVDEANLPKHSEDEQGKKPFSPVLCRLSAERRDGDGTWIVKDIRTYYAGAEIKFSLPDGSQGSVWPSGSFTHVKVQTPKGTVASHWDEKYTVSVQLQEDNAVYRVYCEEQVLGNRFNPTP